MNPKKNNGRPCKFCVCKRCKGTGFKGKKGNKPCEVPKFKGEKGGHKKKHHKKRKRSSSSGSSSSGSSSSD
eukprot:CAMPEP_0168622578 /NCGR_PEP_ID=MMETSP0449_2-20121227/8346_1 /TAXON_ID=1082188 /ORGANISM="Strombidium rassoulzadegani, Strain ras09" /LENGTH=70 /DNA_ID=CAMNT_0008663861 /DNA_START=500 /DNA_END=712 /DNA_ORIENTATION=+